MKISPLLLLVIVVLVLFLLFSRKPRNEKITSGPDSLYYIPHEVHGTVPHDTTLYNPSMFFHYYPHVERA